MFNENDGGEPGGFKSLNPETGLLEDIKEVRQEALAMVWFMKQLLQHPAAFFLLPLGLRMDAADLVVGTESLLRPMSQKEFLRELHRLIFGEVPPRFEWEMALKGYSDTLPRTHPDAPHPDLGDLNDPRIQAIAQDSYVLREALARQNQTQPLETPQPRPVPPALPTDVQAFLDSLMSDEHFGE